MSEIPRSVLSEQFTDRLKGRRLVSALFTTFRFDPGFFEQEVLPVLLDMPLSHATPIRLLQLEDALRDLGGQVAVYYDAGGLVCSDSGSAKLDFRRIPVAHKTGIFHGKNVFALVEEKDPDDDEVPGRSLLVASLSANLTRAGWWENVEAAHIEEIVEGDKTRLRDDLISFLRDLRGRVADGTDQSALEEIRRFLSRSTEPRVKRSTWGQMHTHFFDGTGTVPDFLERTAGNRLQNTYLEVISPYFDDAAESRPIQELIERFQPKEMRVYLPRGPQGEVLCRPEFYESVRATPGVAWSSLPKDLLKMGSGEDTGRRFVHAKVYRFFTASPKMEIVFVGSANLTCAAHGRGGNLESGFLVETEPARRPDFWLTAEDRKATRFAEKVEGEETASVKSCPLILRYTWSTGVAETWWNESGRSPVLKLEVAGVTLGLIGPLDPGQWIRLDGPIADELAGHLPRTSFVTVSWAGRDPVTLLVQEEGMSHKPALLTSLSVSDILKYWALLTVEQRTAFLESRAHDLGLTGAGAELLATYRPDLLEQTLFDRFAGIFHSFVCLEKFVNEALESRHASAAECRIFGRKYDSLGTLLDRVTDPKSTFDDIERFVIVLCAQQLLDRLRKEHGDFWSENERHAGPLRQQVQQLRHDHREGLKNSGPADMPRFLEWFESWFLARAAQIEDAS